MMRGLVGLLAVAELIHWLPMVVPKYLFAGLLKLSTQNELIKDEIHLQQQNENSCWMAAPALHFRQLMDSSYQTASVAAVHGQCEGSRGWWV